MLHPKFFLVFALAVSCLAENPPAPAAPSEPESQFLQARAYLHGEGCPKDPAKAFELMKQAADQGYPEAEAGLGYLYSAGLGVAKDDRLAVQWLRKGAEHGSAKAQYNLSRTLKEGRGTPADAGEALLWLQRATDQGLPEALGAQGEAIYFDKEGDTEKAFALLQKAAGKGHARSQNLVGLMLRDGKGVKRDLDEAARWFQRAAEQGNPKAQSNLGQTLLARPRNQSVKIAAMKWLMIADSRNEITATKALGEILPHMNEKDIAESRRQAAEFLGQSSH